MLVNSKRSECVILGGTTHSISLVPWNPSGPGGRSNFRLLYKEFIRSPHGKTLLERTLRAVSNFNCARCITYLSYVFDKGNSPIRIGEIQTTPLRFQEELSAASIMPADCIGPITFLGGPPNQNGLYQGTFVTILQDSILRAVYTNDTKRLVLLRNARILDA